MWTPFRINARPPVDARIATCQEFCGQHWNPLTRAHQEGQNPSTQWSWLIQQVHNLSYAGKLTFPIHKVHRSNLLSNNAFIQYYSAQNMGIFMLWGPNTMHNIIKHWLKQWMSTLFSMVWLKPITCTGYPQHPINPIVWLFVLYLYYICPILSMLGPHDQGASNPILFCGMSLGTLGTDHLYQSWRKMTYWQSVIQVVPIQIGTKNKKNLRFNLHYQHDL